VWTAALLGPCAGLAAPAPHHAGSPSSSHTRAHHARRRQVIPKELEHPDGHRLAKVAALMLGFGLMSLLAVWA
jgi:hypothetical protein